MPALYRKRGGGQNDQPKFVLNESERVIKLTSGWGGGGFGAISAIDSFSLYFLLSLATMLSWRRENGSSKNECWGLELNGDVGAGERFRVGLF